MNRILVSLVALSIVSLASFGADVIYVAEEQLMRVTIVRPNGTLQPLADGVGLVYGLTLDAAGNVYAAGTGYDIIRKVTPLGAVSAFASGTILGSPMGMVFDDLGNLFTTGYGWGGTINRISPNGVITRVTTGLGGSGLARDTAGNLYVAGGSSVVKFGADGVATTIASGFQYAWGLAFDHSGNLFVTDYIDDSLSKITPGGTVSRFARGLNRPTGLAFDSTGTLYVCNVTSDQPLGYLAKVTPDGIVSIFATGLNLP